MVWIILLIHKVLVHNVINLAGAEVEKQLGQMTLVATRSSPTCQTLINKERPIAVRIHGAWLEVAVAFRCSLLKPYQELEHPSSQAGKHLVLGSEPSGHLVAG